MRAIATLLVAVAATAGCGDPTPRPDVTTDVTTDATGDSAMDARPDGGCVTNDDCSDGVYCNGVERCVGGACMAGPDPCDDRRSCTREVCDEETDACIRRPDDAPCSDGNACNGAERCNPQMPGADSVTGCLPPSSEPLDCNDDNTCTVDACDMASGCVHSPRDLDGDGHVDRSCTLDGRPGSPPGDDCNDGDVTAYPGATEICDDGRDNDCDGRTDLVDTDGCTASNDTCETATRLTTVMSGTGTYPSSTVGVSDDYPLSCNTGSFVDAVYEFTTTALHDVVITTTATGTNSAIALVRDCTAGSELRCVRASSSTASPSLTARSLPAGTYRILVETGPVARAFNLTLRLDPPTPIPGGDVCPGGATDPVIELNDGLPHTVMLSTLEHEYTLACRTTASGTSARDAVYRLTLTEPRDVDLTATAATGTTYIDLRNAPCAPAGASRACASGSTSSPARVRQRNLPAGTYWVFAENSSTTNPDVTVTATLTPPVSFVPNDRCPEAAGDPVDELNDGLVHTLRLAPTEDDYTIACRSSASGFSARDGVLQLTLTETRDVTLRASAVTGTTYVMVRNAPCNASASTIACYSGDPAVTRLRSLPAGNYYVFIENSATTNPEIYVTATLSTPTAVPPGDVCPATATDPVVELNDGLDHIVLLSSTDDNYELSCSSTTTVRRDAVFRLTLAADSDVVLDANVLGSGTTYVSLREGACNGTGSVERRCYSTSGTDVLTARGLRAGTYWVLVESSSLADPEARVRATITTPPVTRAVGDSCATAAVITPDGPAVTINKSDLLLGVDVGNTCGSGTGAGATYADAIYTFTLPAPADVTVTMNRLPTTSSTIADWQLASSCSRAGLLDPCKSWSSGSSPSTQVYQNLPAGTYYIISDISSPATATLTSISATVTTAPPAGSYSAMEVPGATAVDACALPGAVTVLASADNDVATVPRAFVPFPVRYFNQEFTGDFVISSNGWLGFGTRGTGTTGSTQSSSSSLIGSTTDPESVAAAYWRNITLGARGVCYAINGTTAGSREFIVQWNDAVFSSGSAGERLNFQLVIRETAASGVSNPIDLVYREMNGAETTTTGSRAGLESADAAYYFRYGGPYTAISATEPRVLRFTHSIP